MQDYPPFADRGRRERGEHGYEQHDRTDTGASLWIAVTSIIIALALLMLFSQERLSNGGAPFVITPPSQVNPAPNGGL